MTKTLSEAAEADLYEINYHSDSEGTAWKARIDTDYKNRKAPGK